jgi:hypothetical protein
LKSKLYERELLEKLVSKEELKILEIAWEDEPDVEKKIERLLEGK